MLKCLILIFCMTVNLSEINGKNILITSNELNSIINEKSFVKTYRIIEAGFGSKSKKFYEKEHIPGAIYVDVAFDSRKLSFIEYSLPNVEAWQNYLGSLGISNDHKLIIYDRSEFGFKQSSRLRYLIEIYGYNTVQILNGGYNDWIRNNYRLSSEIPQYSKEDYKVFYEPELLRIYEEIIENIESKNEILIDARNSSEYDDGHIPGALNMPYNKFFDSKTRLLKRKEELMEMVNKIGFDLDKPIIAYCQSGIRASTLKLVLDLLGAQKVSVYNGSWFEYSQKSFYKFDKIFNSLMKIFDNVYSLFF